MFILSKASAMKVTLRKRPSLLISIKFWKYVTMRSKISPFF